MKLAFFSPLNPIQSGISDYSEELLLALADAKVASRPVDIDLFIDRGYTPSNPQITRRFDVLHARSFAARAEKYDSVVYQMGNSSAHAYIYDALMHYPGVVVMHEFVLHHLRVWMTLNRGRRREYLDIMERRHGSEGREAARRVLLGQFPEALFNYPLSDEVIHKARGIIVHSEHMARLVREARPDVSLSVVPMGVPLPPLIPKEEARARLGIDPDTFLVTSVGHLNPYKRVSATLRAFKALLMEAPNSLYLLIGSRSPNYDPARQITMLGLQGHVRSTGYVSRRDLPYYLAASDACLNLRYPTAGETSASLLRIMGAGVPVLVSRTGAFEELPNDAVGKVDVGDIEEELLLEYLLLLASRPDLRAAMSNAARAYIARCHTLEGEARGYLNFLLQVATPGTEQSVQVHRAAATEQKAEGREQKQALSKIEPPPLPESRIGLPYDPLSIVAEAATEMGIEESDTAVLSVIAEALQGVVSDHDHELWIRS